MRCQERYENEYVFSPLMEAACLEHCPRQVGSVAQHQRDFAAPSSLPLNSTRRVDRYRPPRRSPDAEVHAVIRGIIEPTLAKLRDQKLSLRPTREIDLAIAGENLLENTQMFRHFICDPLIRRGRQNNRAARPIFILKKGEKCLIVRKKRDIEVDASRNFLLQECFPAQQPEWQ